MKHVRSILLVPVLVTLCLIMIACGVPTPSSITSTATQPVPTPVLERTIGPDGTCIAPAGGVACHFVSPAGSANPVDITLLVPRQLSGASLTFKAELRNATDRPKDGPGAPDKKDNIYRNFMGLTVTDEKGTPVDHFDPAITIIAKYFPIDLDLIKKNGKGDPNYLGLWLHDGAQWRRLPMLPGSRVSNPDGTGTLTSYIGSFTSADDVGDGGDR